MTLKTRAILVLYYFIFLIILLNYTEGKNSDCKNTFLEIMLELCHGSRLTREVHIPRDKYGNLLTGLGKKINIHFLIVYLYKF